MRRLLLICGLLAVPALLSAQVTRVATSGTLPASCVVGNVYAKTGSGAGFYVCLATNTWSGPYSSEALPATTADAIPVGDGSDFQARVLPSCSNSTSSKLLYNSSTDTFSCGTDQGGGGTGTGGTVLLEQHTASTSASLDFTTCISSTYDEYLIEFVNILPATDNVFFQMRMSTNGGSSYDNSSLYAQSNYGATTAGAGSSGNSIASPTTQIAIVGPTDSVDNTSTNYGVTGSWRLYSPSSTSLYKMLTGLTSVKNNSGASALVIVMTSAVYQSTTAVNAFQFFMSSGDIASGTIRCYGLVK